MSRNKKHFAEKLFSGTGWFSWLNFKGKVFTGAIVFLVGILLQGSLILAVYVRLKQDSVKENRVYSQSISRIQSLGSLSPVLLSRCQSGLTPGVKIELSDVEKKIDADLSSLKRLQQKNPKFNTFLRSYQLLDKQLGKYSGSSLSLPQYLEIRRFYDRYTASLNNLEQNLNRSQKNIFSLLFKEKRLLLAAIFVLVIITSLSCLLLSAAVKSIMIPAKLMTDKLNDAKQHVFNVEIPITSNEGMGNVALILKESLKQWNTLFLDSKDSISRFDSLCKELVSEIRKTELFAIQFQQVAEALTDNFENQNRLITESHEQLTVLLDNGGTLHNIPQRIMVINDDLQNQLGLVRAQVSDILDKPVAYQDESPEIAGLAENLNMASEQINKVVLILNEVAERTELLAFNTAIQAARAGEKGLGFGVVAKEIAKLVDHSKRASERLSDLLNKARVKNDLILKLIAENPGSVAPQIPLNQAASEICDKMFKAAGTSFKQIEELGKVMEIISRKGAELTKEAQLISRLTTQEDVNYEQLDVEILDYQLNVKEANRLAVRVSEVSKDLKVLAEAAAGEDEFLG